uniref:Uncharacterized protein n=1 Tax=Palpitomonas bilix TaxID=652834 RepID=A0A7S3LTZ6_9EUKA|mmetsp:Transcript_46539/g.120101  ORF Transcript_46539/g.120101 Transcript_46539/m.120101 type:complete len:133 (+) Transcript_46539:193-591(+)
MAALRAIPARQKFKVSMNSVQPVVCSQDSISCAPYLANQLSDHPLKGAQKRLVFLRSMFAFTFHVIYELSKLVLFTMFCLLTPTLDKHCTKSLLQLVADRKGHMQYLRKENPTRYEEILKELGVRDTQNQKR